MNNKKNEKQKKIKNEKTKNKEVVLRSTKMKFIFDYNAFISSFFATQQNLTNFVAQVSPLLPYAPDYQSSQTIHHWRMLDEDDKCFRITNQQNSYNVEILRDIVLSHDVSIPARWGGNIKVTINKNWGITMSFSTPDGWIQRNQWVYGFLKFSSGDNTASTMNGSCCGVGGAVYSRNLFFYSDDDINYREEAVDLKAFRQGDGPQNVYQQINTPNLSSSIKILRNVDSETNSICVLRYKAYIQGYYAGQPTNNMTIYISGNLNVKLPGYKIQTPEERYRYITTQPPETARRNGNNFVYHRSDCGYPNVRMYSSGGDGPGSACGYWVDTLLQLSAGSPVTKPNLFNLIYTKLVTNGTMENNVIGLTHADLVWYGVPPSARSNILQRTASNKYYDRPQSNWNWSIDDFIYYTKISG